MKLYTKILLGMLVGVLLGLLVGPNSFMLPQGGVRLGGGASVLQAPSEDAEPEPLAEGLATAKIVEVLDPEAVEDDPRWLRIAWTLDSRERLALEQAGVDVADAQDGEPIIGFVDESTIGVTRYSRLGQTFVDCTEWIGRLFLALIKMVVVPLVFCSLAVGVASLGDISRLGRIGSRTLGLFVVTTCLALMIGVGLANLVGPGRFVGEADRAQLLASYEGAAQTRVDSATEAPGFVDQLLNIVPGNPLAALASGQMLQIIFFALALGIALTLIDDRHSQPVLDGLIGVNEAMIKLVHLVMKLAPYGVAALLFKVVGTTGFSVLLALSVYALVVVSGLLLHMTFVYGGLVKLGARLPFLGFLAGIRSALMVAFSTSSSSAALPVTKECCENNLGVSPQVSSFVLPLGATVNMDGTALYQGVAAIFIAQIYGLDLSLSEQATVVGTATLASVGAAGVPGAGIITLVLVLTAINVPTEGLALILGVDRLLDMLRTTVNVVGDSTATTVMARLEGDSIHPPGPKIEAFDRPDDEPVEATSTEEPTDEPTDGKPRAGGDASATNGVGAVDRAEKPPEISEVETSDNRSS